MSGPKPCPENLPLEWEAENAVSGWHPYRSRAQAEEAARGQMGTGRIRPHWKYERYGDPIRVAQESEAS